MVEMADHHRVEQPFLGERPVGLDLDLLPGLGDVGEHLVAVGACSIHARESASPPWRYPQRDGRG